MRQLGNKNLGFTLLEMLLVLTLIAGAGFMLLVKLPLNFEREHLALAATQFLGDIRDTRQAALAENSWYAVKFYSQTAEDHYQIFRQGTKLKDVYLRDGIQFLGSPQDLTFNAMGRGAGATIVLKNSQGEEKRVIIAPVGMRIREE